MKKTTAMKMAAGFLTVCVALNVLALDPEISNVVVRQRWPWSRLVNIDFVLACEATQRVDVAVTAYDGGTPLPLPSDSLSGDLYGVSNGARRIVWNPSKTVYTDTILPRFGVTLAPTAPYLVVDLVTGQFTRQFAFDAADDAYRTAKLVLRRIPAGTFSMGSPTNEFSRYTLDAREAQHQVTLTKDFYMGVFEVTQAQWGYLMGDRPSWFTNSLYWETRPVDQVAYTNIRGSVAGLNWPATNTVDSASFIGQLRSKTGVNSFDLPTEAQWEYACRAGRSGSLNDGTANLDGSSTDTHLALLGRYRFNGGYINDSTGPSNTCTTANGTAKAGSYVVNAWGLYDMHGNVWEWCLDRFTASLGSGPAEDPPGGATGSNRTLRGGAFASYANQCRSAYRLGTYAQTSIDKSFGFRLAIHDVTETE